MNPGDALTGDRWVTAVADVRQHGQAVYVHPPGQWQWASDVESEVTGARSPAVAQEFTPSAKNRLIEFLLDCGVYKPDIATAAGVTAATVRKQATRLGKVDKTPPIGYRKSWRARLENSNRELDEWRDRLYAWAEAEKEKERERDIQ